MAETKNPQMTTETVVGPNANEAFLLKYKYAIIGGIVVLLLAVAGYFFWKTSAKEAFEKNSTAMAKAQEYFSQGVMNNDTTFFTKALYGDSINAGFLKVANDASGKVANLANLYIGICYANLGNIEEASKFLSQFDDADDQMVSPAVKGALGNAKAAMGELDEAVNILKKAAADADNNALSPVFLIQAGEILESQGKKAEALELYQQIKTKYQDWTRYNSIDSYIERVK